MLLRLLQSSTEYVLEAIQSDLDYFTVHDRQQVAQRRDAALVDEEPDLIRRSTRHGIGDCPRRLLASFKLRPTHYVNQRRYYVSVDHRLHSDAGE